MRFSHLPDTDPEKLTGGWQMIQKNIGRTSDLVMDLLSYSKQREPEYEACQPNDIAEDVCELLEGVARDHDVSMVKQFSGQITPVVMDPRTVHRWQPLRPCVLRDTSR